MLALAWNEIILRKSVDYSESIIFFAHSLNRNAKNLCEGYALQNLAQYVECPNSWTMPDW